MSPSEEIQKEEDAKALKKIGDDLKALDELQQFVKMTRDVYKLILEEGKK
jgi:hypothetical protein